MSYNITVFMNFKGEIFHTLEAPYGVGLKEAIDLARKKADEMKCFFYMIRLIKVHEDELTYIHKLTKGKNVYTKVDVELLDTPPYRHMKNAIQTIRLLKG